MDIVPNGAPEEKRRLSPSHLAKLRKNIAKARKAKAAKRR